MKYVIATNGKRVSVKLEGDINESCHDTLSRLKNEIPGGEVDLDLGGINWINSPGVANWTSFLRGLKTKATFELHRCPIPFVDYLNVITSFSLGAPVKSLYVPYFCKGCQKGYPVLMNTPEPGLEEFPPAPCDKCNKEMAPDVSAEDYLVFLG